MVFSLITGFILAANLSATAQTRISYAKGTSEKTITVTIPANGKKNFVLAVNKNQAINANALLQNSDDLIFIGFNLDSAKESVDKWQDYEGGLTVLTGRKGDYIFSVINNTKKTMTFKMKIRVGGASEYDGGGDE